MGVTSAFRGLHPPEAGRGGRGWWVEAEGEEDPRDRTSSVTISTFLEQAIHAQTKLHRHKTVQREKRGCGPHCPPTAPPLSRLVEPW